MNVTINPGAVISPLQNIGSIALSLTIASYANWLLLGILGTQVYLYYLAFPKDSRLAKSLVYGVFVWELIQTGLVSQHVSWALGSGLGNVNRVDSIHTTWLSLTIWGGTTGGIGQLYFAYRIFRISESQARVAPILISSLALASLGSSFAAAVTFFEQHTFSSLISNFSDTMASVGLWNGLGAICDVFIALVMPYYLMRHGTGVRNTHIMIVRLVGVIIETGLLTAVIAMLHLCLYFSQNDGFIVPGLTISKFYANTMLALLNNRLTIANGRFQRRTAMRTTSMSQITSTTSAQFVQSGSEREFIDLPPRPRARLIINNDRITFRMDDFTPPSSPRKLESPKANHVPPGAVTITSETFVHRDQDSLNSMPESNDGAV